MCSCRIESRLLSLRLLLLLVIGLHDLLLPLREVLLAGSWCLGSHRRRMANASVAVLDDLFDSLDADIVTHGWYIAEKVTTDQR